MNFKKVTAIALACSLATASIAPQAVQPLSTVQAATKIKLNKTKTTIKVGKTVQLKVTGTKKKVKWSSSNSRIATVNSKGKVTGKKAGKAKITAKISSKKLTCTITVTKSKPAPTPKPTKKPTAKPKYTPFIPNTPDETSDPDIMETPFVTVIPDETTNPAPVKTPSVTIAPDETSAPQPSLNPVTAKPVNTDAPAVPTTEPGKQVSLNLDFYLGAYDYDSPNEQFVNVYFANHLNESVFVESEAYVTTRGENYPALISFTKLGEKKEIQPTYPDDTYGERVTYDSLDYVLNGSNCTMLWLPLDENSTLTFFFNIGDKRYKAVINFEQKGAIYREATDYEQLEPFQTATPSETTKPIETITPSQTKAPVETPTPSAEPTATPEPKKLEDLNVEFYLEPYNPNETEKLYIYVYYSNHSNETAFIEKNAYLTTRGTNYPLALSGTGDEGYIALDPTTLDEGYHLSFYTPDITMMIPVDENSTLTFFFRIGDKRYKATINYDKKGGIYYDSYETEPLIPSETTAPFETAAPFETETPSKTDAPIETITPSETDAPVETPTPSAEPTATPEPNKLEDLNVEFYLEPYNSNETKKIYIYAYYSNHSNETAFIEKDAYLTTRGTNYPLELGGTQDKDYITLKPGDTSDGGFPLCFNTTDITTNIPIDEDSTLTFFFRMGNKRYKATINYNQKGGIYYDADAME